MLSKYQLERDEIAKYLQSQKLTVNTNNILSINERGLSTECL